MAQEETNLVNEKALEDKRRAANMISEGGMGAMYYYNYQFYNDEETDKSSNKMQDTTQQIHMPPH
jgi:hypothetical protein